MKALEILKAITESEGTHLWLDDGSGYPKSYIYEAIKELESFQSEYEKLNCNCGSLGRVGYLCSNKECSEK